MDWRNGWLSSRIRTGDCWPSWPRSGLYENFLGIRSDFPVFLPQPAAAAGVAVWHAARAGTGVVCRAAESLRTDGAGRGRAETALHLSLRRVAGAHDGRAVQDAAGASV